ncbi:MAG: RidA family protein [Burkholderiaceae bacterium]|nr:RidA family protein [Burkholderiaceae bacterium]MDH3459534.1 RidA family protein [Burkholderiaceae bacterium]
MTDGVRRFHVGHRMSEMAIHRGTVHLAGQVAGDATQDVKSQTIQVLAAVDRLLHEAGTNKTRVVTAQIFLADLTDFASMNEVRDTWVTPGEAPPRATVQARRVRPEWKIDIVVTAAL